MSGGKVGQTSECLGFIDRRDEQRWTPSCWMAGRLYYPAAGDEGQCKSCTREQASEDVRRQHKRVAV